MRFGVDLGGTKTEIIALDDTGVERHRERVDTDAANYDRIVATIARLVTSAEATLGCIGTVGVGIPGTISAHTGLVKNANANILNGHALDRDLSRALQREVRCMNDANCLALSEAVDGAAAGYEVVFAVILGTGCGAGVAFNGRAWPGPNLVAGEFGHNPLPWMTADEYPGPACWCGKFSCIEKWISGTGFSDDYERALASAGATSSSKTSPHRLKGPEIVALARSGNAAAREALHRYADRLTRCLAHVINILDPAAIVLGGGMSNVDELYDIVPSLLPKYVFGKEATTPVLRNHHGDSSGVRGAAWLWAKA